MSGRTMWIFLPGALAFLLPLMLYGGTLCPTVPVGDGGELICAAHSLGIAHPPGYPLYCLVGRLFVLLPLGNAAMRINLMSAFFAALAAVGVYLLVAQLDQRTKGQGSFWRPVAALSAALIFAFSETFWSQAVQAEVYTLHTLLVALVLLAMVRWQTQADGRMAHIWAFLSGLALAHHTSTIFLLGAALWLLIGGRRQLAVVKRLPVMVLFFLLGVSLYLYLPLRSSLQPPHDWGNPETMGRLWDHITARQYQRLLLVSSPTDMLRSLRHYLSTLGQQWFFVLLPLALAGAVVQFRRHRDIFVLLLLAILGDVLLAISYDIPDIEAYYLPSYLIFSVWMGLAVSASLHWLQSRVVRQNLLRSFLVVPAALAAITVVMNLPPSSQRTRTIARDYGLNILSSVAPAGILFTAADNETFPALYLHDVEGIRPDMEIFDLGSTPQRLRRFVGLEHSGGEEDPVRMREMVVQRTRRPVCFSKEHLSLATDPLQHRDWRLEPAGLVYRLHRSPGETIAVSPPWARYIAASFKPIRPFSDYKAAMMVANYHLSHGEDLLAQGDTSAAGEAFAVARGAIGHVDQAQIHNSMGVFFRRLGRMQDALEEFHLALGCAQRTRAQESDIFVNLGNISVDQGRLDTAQTQLERALRIWPENPAARFNLARLRASQFMDHGDYAAAAGEYRDMLAIEPDNPTICYNLGLLLAHRLGQPQQAMACFRRCLDIAPQGALSQSARLELEQLQGKMSHP